MTPAGRTAVEKALIDSGLEGLTYNWGSAYEIEFSDEHGWRARRRDGLGGWLTGTNPDELYKAITDDYALKPVPRSYMPAE
ncbi:MAG TPA: hypothetical protein VMA73_20130 [Streptosporangiaceae bacterium]|nr:hypothetical protein [Streptosporangiaceae bacterium]